MGVDVFLAVAARIALKQVLDAVGQSPQPTAENNAVHFGTVLHQHAQQAGQIRRGPVTIDKALGKADVAGFQCASKRIPVFQVQRGMWIGTVAKALHTAIGQMQREAAVADFLQQLQHRARCRRRAFSSARSAVFGSGLVHGG